MNKTEFSIWVKGISERINNDKTVHFHVLPEGIVIAYDIDKMKSTISKCDKGGILDKNTNKAIAYARLRGFEIPKVEKELRFKNVKYNVGYNKEYYSIRLSDKGFVPSWIYEQKHSIDNMDFKNNNYFHTKERAKKVINKMKFLLKLERLHDIYCPDYVPNFTDKDELQYCVFYNYPTNKWEWAVGYNTETITDVYFPTGEIAEKVCDILNEENKNE